MTSGTEFEKQLTNILHDAANKLTLKKYSLNLNLHALKGDGFLGEFYKVSILDEETGTIFHLAVKRALTDPTWRKQNYMDLVYQNEIHFYSVIFPALSHFEKEHQVAEPFNFIPRYLTSCCDREKEIIVFEDLTKLDYVLRDKGLLLDDAHAKLIFETYGHFHAISFCLKAQRPDEFYRLTKPLNNIWEKWCASTGFSGVLSKMAEKCYEILNSNNETILAEKFQKYNYDVMKIFQESFTYHGQYFGILHGDCWSNNMMFKYDNSSKFSILRTMNLLDFQLIHAGTPVCDLSYFFYTGGSKELFGRLEEYLDLYYESFSKVAKNLGSDPNEIFPRKALSQDWREHSKFGMLMALLLTKVKLQRKEDGVKIMESTAQEVEDGTAFMNVPYDEELFEKRILDIVTHMSEIDAL